ncbi:MAG: spore coat associated protein CotJA [Oscillospiraceae bacterium]
MNNDISIFTNQEISYGMLYVPYQQWGEIYDVDVAFKRGTLFPCLDKPFLGEEALPRG